MPVEGCNCSIAEFAHDGRGAAREHLYPKVRERLALLTTSYKEMIKTEGSALEHL
jgi:hypothetical protein